MFSKKEKLLLAALAFIQFSHVVDFMIMMPLGPQFMRIFKISPHQFGLLVSAYTFSAAIMAITSALFMDMFDRKKSLLFFYVGFCGSTIACALSPNYDTLLLSRILAGSFGGVMSAIVMAIVGDAIRPEKRGAAMGVVMMAFSVASVFGVPFSLFLANQYDWHAPFMFLGIVSALMIFVIIFAVPPIRTHLDSNQALTAIRDEESLNSFQKIWLLLSDRNIFLALLFMFSLVLGQFTIIPFISPSFVANAGMKESQLPLIYLLGGLFTIFSSPWVGRMSDKFGRKKVFYFGVAISLLPIYVITNLGPTPVYFILPWSILLFMAMGGRMIPAMTLVTSTVKPHHRGALMSLNSSTQQFASAIASYLAGVIIVKNEAGQLLNYDKVGYIALFFSFVAAYLVKNIKTVE